MSISQIKEDALKALKGNWGKGVAISIILIMFSFLGATIEITLSGGFENWNQYNETDIFPTQVYIGNIIYTLLSIPLSVGIYWFFLKLSNHKSVNSTYVFSTYKDIKLFFKLISLTLVQTLFILLWSILFIIPGFIKAIGYSQAFFILKENPELGILEVLSESQKRMKGLKWKFFLLNLSFIGWILLTPFTIFIGFLWLLPYVYTAQASFYKLLISK